MPDDFDAPELLGSPVLGGFSLRGAIDALKAHDHGATDSGVSDPGLRAAVKAYLRRMPDGGRRAALARVARSYLADEAIAQGYGLEDIRSLIEWLDELDGGLR